MRNERFHAESAPDTGRRGVALAGIAMLMGVSAAGVQAQVECSEREAEGDAEACLARVRTSPDDWVQAGLGRRPFGAPLSVTRFLDRFYCLNRDFEWTPKLTVSGLSKTVAPTGFVTDFTSIPRVFWAVLAPEDEYLNAAVIHDWLYWTQGGTRDAADFAMRMAMEELPVEAWKIATIYRGLRIFGQSAWDENASLKAKGERRVIRQLPTKADIRWADWKLKSEIY